MCCGIVAVIESGLALGEQRVADQVGEIERMSRLRRFLPPQVAGLIVASGAEKQLESHRREITALFCDLRGFNCRAAWRHMTVRLAIGKVYEDLANTGNAQSEAAIAEAGIRIKALGNAENESYGIEMGYSYADSPVIMPEPFVDVPQDPVAYEPTTLPGSRLPNIYFADGTPLHDKLGRWFSLLAFDGAATDHIAAAAARRGIPLEIIRIDDPEVERIYQAKIVLVRPDQHVCWRGSAQNDSDQAEYLLARALGRYAAAID
jgi:hypothetical protein